ncbi:formamidopyrimidine-DNA glycosylase H2TH domain protein [Mycobacterium kansasii]|uniref:Formamidopyrimidine-DNA glycosylase H2TH domain protein n=1 Tax=Mycobacterium kansasii TaxID=1768 RepID=A0A1V3XJ57_MYCKA|nr:formamidopyrimidine-DNA glycosylase H2TH domain protein [Mycobacterium kansasii]
MAGRRSEACPGIAALGPDALELSTEDLAGLLAGNTGRIKTVITDQKVIAGIGNAYSDEILHVAKISPFATAGKLSAGQLATLHDAMVSVLSDAVHRSVGQGAAMLKGRSAPGYGCTPAPACPARCVETPCGKCRSRTSLSSTVRGARPEERCWPTGACRGC